MSGRGLPGRLRPALRRGWLPGRLRGLPLGGGLGPSGRPLLNVPPGGLLGGFQLPLGALLRQNIFQGKFLVVLCHRLKILLLRIDRL